MTTLIAPQITAPDERNLLISIENLHMSADPGSVSFWSSITSEAKTAEGWPYWQSIRKQPFTVTHAWLISKFPNTGSKVIAGMKMGLPDNDLIKLLLSDADCAVDTTDSESIPGDIA